MILWCCFCFLFFCFILGTSKIMFFSRHFFCVKEKIGERVRKMHNAKNSNFLIFLRFRHMKNIQIYISFEKCLVFSCRIRYCSALMYVQLHSKWYRHTFFSWLFSISQRSCQYDITMISLFICKI